MRVKVVCTLNGEFAITLDIVQWPASTTDDRAPYCAEHGSRGTLRETIDALGRSEYRIQCDDCGARIMALTHARVDELRRNITRSSGVRAWRRLAPSTWDRVFEETYRNLYWTRVEAAVQAAAIELALASAHARSPVTYEHPDLRQLTKERYHAYLCSDAWAQKRVLVIKRANGLCEVCKSRRGREVHHLTYKRIYRERAEDLQLLCRPCHETAHEAKLRAPPWV